MSDTEKNLRAVEMELREHEVQCEERWKTTFTRLERIEEQLIRMEQRQMAGGAALILFLAGIIAAIKTQA